MKRISLLLLAVVLLAATLASCNSGDDESQVVYGNRTQYFYAGMANGVFWYDASIVTASGTMYGYSQATDGVTVTTIVDKTGTANDTYEIFYNGNERKCVHKLNVAAKKYDTWITDKGQAFLFDGYNYTMFVNLISSGEEQLNDRTYYCEVFRSTGASGSEVGYDKYYYEGDKLCAVVTPSVTIYFNDYSSEIPETVYMNAPAEYKQGLLIEDNYIEFSDWIGDMSIDLDLE